MWVHLNGMVITTPFIQGFGTLLCISREVPLEAIIKVNKLLMEFEEVNQDDVIEESLTNHDNVKMKILLLTSYFHRL